jgi:hypothetical protein
MPHHPGSPIVAVSTQSVGDTSLIVHGYTWSLSSVRHERPPEKRKVPCSIQGATTGTGGFSLVISLTPVPPRMLFVHFPILGSLSPRGQVKHPVGTPPNEESRQG